MAENYVIENNRVEIDKSKEKILLCVKYVMELEKIEESKPENVEELKAMKNKANVVYKEIVKLAKVIPSIILSAVEELFNEHPSDSKEYNWIKKINNGISPIIAKALEYRKDQDMAVESSEKPIENETDSSGNNNVDSERSTTEAVDAEVKKQVSSVDTPAEEEAVTKETDTEASDVKAKKQVSSVDTPAEEEAVTKESDTETSDVKAKKQVSSVDTPAEEEAVTKESDTEAVDAEVKKQVSSVDTPAEEEVVSEETDTEASDVKAEKQVSSVDTPAEKEAVTKESDTETSDSEIEKRLSEVDTPAEEDVVTKEPDTETSDAEVKKQVSSVDTPAEEEVVSEETDTEASDVKAEKQVSSVDTPAEEEVVSEETESVEGQSDLSENTNVLFAQKLEEMRSSQSVQNSQKAVTNEFDSFVNSLNERSHRLQQNNQEFFKALSKALNSPSLRNDEKIISIIQDIIPVALSSNNDFFEDTMKVVNDCDGYSDVAASIEVGNGTKLVYSILTKKSNETADNNFMQISLLVPINEDKEAFDPLELFKKTLGDQYPNISLKEEKVNGVTIYLDSDKPGDDSTQELETTPNGVEGGDSAQTNFEM